MPYQGYSATAKSELSWSTCCGKCCLSLLFPLTGQEPTDAVVDGMMSEAPGPLNFTMFLTLFGEKLTGKWPQDMVLTLCSECPFMGTLLVFGRGIWCLHWDMSLWQLLCLLQLTHCQFLQTPI